MATAAPKHECGARQAVSARGHLFRCNNTKIGADSRRIFWQRPSPERPSRCYGVFPKSEIDPASMLRHRIERKT
jgi:hypothetical protein